MSYMAFLALKEWWIQQIKDINDFAASVKLQQTLNVDQLHNSLYCCSVCMERWSKHLTNHSQDIQPRTVKCIIYLLCFLKRQKCRLVRSWCSLFWSSVITVCRCINICSGSDCVNSMQFVLLLGSERNSTVRIQW
jgi:hypothetical protein